MYGKTIYKVKGIEITLFCPMYTYTTQSRMKMCNSYIGTEGKT